MFKRIARYVRVTMVLSCFEFTGECSCEDDLIIERKTPSVDASSVAYDGKRCLGD